jgi:hypothetical protein
MPYSVGLAQVEKPLNLAAWDNQKRRQVHMEVYISSNKSSYPSVPKKDYTITKKL